MRKAASCLHAILSLRFSYSYKVTQEYASIVPWT